MTNDLLPSTAPLPEVLTVEEYADRLKVSRTTVFAWLKNGELREGVDYLRRGRILRFRWPTFPTTQPLPQSAEDLEREPEPLAAPPARRTRPHGKRGPAPAVNLDY